MSSTFVACKVICAVTMGYPNVLHWTTFSLSPPQLQTPQKQPAHAHNPAMAPNTTPTKWEKICNMRAAGYSNDEIWAALTSRYELSDWQISYIMKRYGGKEKYYEVGHSTGHPCKLTLCDAQIACQHLSNQTAHKASDLQHVYFLEVSVDTMKQALWREGLKHIRCTVPFISHKNLHVQKNWAEKWLEWTVNNWEAVDFSDESIFHCVLLALMDGMVFEEARRALGPMVYEEEG